MLSAGGQRLDGNFLGVAAANARNHIPVRIILNFGHPIGRWRYFGASNGRPSHKGRKSFNPHDP